MPSPCISGILEGDAVLFEEIHEFVGGARVNVIAKGAKYSATIFLY